MSPMTINCNKNGEIAIKIAKKWAQWPSIAILRRYTKLRMRELFRLAFFEEQCWFLWTSCFSLGIRLLRQGARIISLDLMIDRWQWWQWWHWWHWWHWLTLVTLMTMMTLVSRMTIIRERETGDCAAAKYLRQVIVTIVIFICIIIIFKVNIIINSSPSSMSSWWQWTIKNQQEKRKVRREAEVLRSLIQSAFVVELVGLFESPLNSVLVTEYLAGGDLITR